MSAGPVTANPTWECPMSESGRHGIREYTGGQRYCVFCLHGYTLSVVVTVNGLATWRVDV